MPGEKAGDRIAICFPFNEDNNDGGRLLIMVLSKKVVVDVEWNLNGKPALLGMKPWTTRQRSMTR
jgi:hypothetical protein